MKSIIFLLTLLTAMTAAAYGKLLTDKNGMTLYTFDKDKAGKSVCYDGCAVIWPPYIAGESAEAKGSWGLVERKDGSMQWTYNDQPLYTWVGDQKAGDTTGDGVGGVWHVAKKSSKKSSYGKKSASSSYDY